MKPISEFSSSNNPYRALYKIGGISSLAMLGIMIAQVMVFVLWPPPDSVIGFYALFQENSVLGLLSLDLLYLINNALLILIYLALYVSLKPAGEVPMVIALIFGLVGIAAYYASTIAFEMLILSKQFALAATEPQKAVFLAAGELALATYKGTAFNVYYVLNAIALLILSIVMLKSEFFSRITAYTGLLAGILMSIPSTAGTLGLYFSLASLVPWAIFLILITQQFMNHGSE